MFSILCGHCGELHDSVSAIKLCAEVHNYGRAILSDTSAPDEAPVTDDPIERFFATAVPQEVVEEDTLYKVGDEIFRTVMAKSGHMYAKKRVGDAWQYEAGAIKWIKPADRMTKEDAAKYGQLTGKCIVCGRKLTDEGSVAAGIGPICAERF